MMSGLIVMGASGSIGLILLLLFAAEDRRGARLFLGQFRSWLDRICLTIGSAILQVVQYINLKVVRISFHYLVHAALTAMIALLHRAQDRLSQLQLRNRNIVKMVRKARVGTHFDQLTTFKRDTALSEAERIKKNKH